MAEWNLYGSERRDIFEEGIEPGALFDTLKQYQKVFGKTFGIVELLELEKIILKEGWNNGKKTSVSRKYTSRFESGRSNGRGIAL